MLDKKLKIMVFESDETHQKAFREVLRPEHFELKMYRKAESNNDEPGGKTTKLMSPVEEVQPDIIFLDLSFTGIEGLKRFGPLLKCNKTDSEKKTLVILTLPAEEYNSLKQTDLSKVYDVMFRPFSAMDLMLKLSGITKCIDWYRSIMDIEINEAAVNTGFSVEHYVGQPLSAIIGALKMLKLLREQGKEITTDDITEMSDIVLSAANELENIIKKFGSLAGYKIIPDFHNDRIIDLSYIKNEVKEEEDPFVF